MKILYEDENYVVCVKPSGVPSQEDGGINMPSILREELRCAEVFPVHRLDTAASGLMVYAKNRVAAAALCEQVRDGGFIKEYLCVVHSEPELPCGEYTDLLFKDSSKNKSYVVKRYRKGVKKASLTYGVIETVEAEGGRMSLVRVRLLTGRTHQIRVQFSSRRTPLCGDGKYGAKDHFNELALFSSGLTFSDPKTGEAAVFACAPPEKVPWTLFDPSGWN